MKGHHKNLRKGRYSQAGQIYHITCRVHRGILTEPERQVISQQFINIDLVGNNRLMAWVIMPDHLHLLIELSSEDTLGSFVGRIKSQTARYVNRHRGNNSPLWQRGYFDRAIRKEDDITAIARYIVANPVRAGLVKSVRQYPYWNAIWL